MRVAVTGASGLLGCELASVLRDRGHNIYAAVHSTPVEAIPTDHRISLDLGHDESIREFVHTAKAEIVVHAAAMTDVDGCELNPERALRLHAAATDTLAIEAVKSDSRVIYISTDYVFDGLSGPYDEQATPHPINEYGRTKLLGEEAVLRCAPGNLIIRAGGFLGYGAPERPTFIERMADAIRNAPPVLAATDLRSNITPVDFLARGIIELMEDGASGIRHVAPAFVVSRFEVATHVADILGESADTVTGVPYASLNRPASRPLDGGLISRHQLKTPAPTWSEVLETFKSRNQSADNN